MATITVGAGNTFRPYRKVRIAHFPECSTQTFAVGDVLVLDTAATVSAGRCKLAGSDPKPILGVAADSASGVTGTRIGVYMADGQGEFRGNIDSSAVLSIQAVGLQYGIVSDSTNVASRIWRVDTSETSAVRVVITEVPNNGGGTIGDFNAEVVFKFVNVDTLNAVTRTPYLA